MAYIIYYIFSISELRLNETCSVLTYETPTLHISRLAILRLFYKTLLEIYQIFTCFNPLVKKQIGE
jgi:hypothetical protein